MGFDDFKFGPPYNLGETYAGSGSMGVKSAIWGVNRNTGEPEVQGISFKYIIMGKWVILSIGSCIHPAKPLYPVNALAVPNSTVYWDWKSTKQKYISAEQWDYASEVTGRPDRIHFTEVLPAIINGDNESAREFPITLEVIDTDSFKGTKQITGKLIISDTGAMEIRGDYTFRAYEVSRDAYGNDTYGDLKVHTAGAIDCGRADIPYTKPGKIRGQADTGYMIGFHGTTIMYQISGRPFDSYKKDEQPTMDSERSYITSGGVNLNAIDNDVRLENSNEQRRLQSTITHYREFLTKYKNYYDSLTDEKKKEVQPLFYELLQDIAGNEWTKLPTYFTINEYIPDTAPQSMNGGPAVAAASTGMVDDEDDDLML